MGSLDDLAGELQRLRAEAGDVSYSELATRITRNRASRGMSEAAARTARSSVYDVFRPGRTRVSVDLVEEIVRALGGDDTAVAAWRARAVEANLARRERAVSSESGPASAAIVVVLCIAAVGVNLMANFTVSSLGLPIYLDMVGTAIAAFAFGPWVGAVVGIATTMTGNAMNGDFSGWGFAFVQVAGALLWGYGFRAWFGRARGRFLALNVVAAVVCSLVAVVVIMVFFGGVSTATTVAELADAARELGASMVSAVLSVNMLTSLADKLISGYLALVAVWLLGRSALGVSEGVRDRAERLLPGVLTRRASRSTAARAALARTEPSRD